MDDVGDLEAQADAAADPVEQAVDVVLARVDAEIIRALRTTSFLGTSSEANGEFYCVVCVEYGAAMARFVEQGIGSVYSRDNAEAWPIQPFFRSLFRYNHMRADDWTRKEMVLTALIFQWLDDPRALLEATSPRTEFE